MVSIDNSERGTAGVSVVVLNWNGKEDTLACLQSLTEVTYRSMRVVVVDNGSSDGSEAAFRASFPDVPVIQSGANLGYAAGNNVGIAYCLKHFDDEFVLLLNNDTVVDPGFLDELVSAAARRLDAGIFGPKIMFRSRPNVIWFAGGVWDAPAARFVHIGEGAQEASAGGATVEVDFITGCAMLVRRRLLERIGLLDDRFFLTFEDCDLCLRARDAGSHCVYVPAAKIWHAVSASFGAIRSPLGDYFFARNRLLFAELHLDLRERLKLYSIALSELAFPPLMWDVNHATATLKRVYWIVRQQGASAFAHYSDVFYRARLAGVRDYFYRRFGNCDDPTRRLLEGSR